MHIALLFIASIFCVPTEPLAAKFRGRGSCLTMDIYGSFSRPVSINLGMFGWAGGKAYINGELQVSFSPWLSKGTSQLVKVTLPLPLGMTIEQSDEDGCCRIIEISGTGSANSGSTDNVRCGDIVRAITSREKKMVYPQAQVALGGIGRPELVTSFVPVERRPDALDQVLNGIVSNSEISPNSDDDSLRREGKVQLILERPNNP
mmetsp:Transcript_33384/g.56044  ORF Transcript_33384/g.56044 Transcript_33384/m.56044 type:complete len:204 (-) Transcript_33384:189-800(-)